MRSIQPQQLLRIRMVCQWSRLDSNSSTMEVKIIKKEER
jgi:hypothetical protein